MIRQRAVLCSGNSKARIVFLSIALATASIAGCGGQSEAEQAYLDQRVKDDPLAAGIDDGLVLEEGWYVCDELSAGLGIMELAEIDDRLHDVPTDYTVRVILAAIKHLCPEHQDAPI